MRIEYRIGYVDRLRFNLWHQFLSPVVNGFFLIFTALIVWSEAQSRQLIQGVLVALTFYVLIWVVQALFTTVYLFTRRSDSVQTRHVLEIKTDALYESTEFNESRLFWPGILRVVTRPGFVAIYVAQHSALIIPNRTFKGNERRQFIDSLNENVDKG
jgi:hypothetical protein